jgi:hypothetical protein
VRLTPSQTSYDPNGPSPVFHVDTGGAQYFAVELAVEPFLFNGAAAGRRTPANYFHSWDGDDRWPARGRTPPRRDVRGARLEAPTGRTSYTVPPAVWLRLRRAPRLYYRLLVTDDERRRPSRGTFADVDWRRAPGVAVVSLPARPTRSPVAAFRGSGALSRTDLLTYVSTQLGMGHDVHGRDGNFVYTFLYAPRVNMTVVDCHDAGLTDTVALMPRKPDAVINAQFISDVVGVGTEGQVIREGRIVNPGAFARRSYIAQTWRGADASDYRMGEGTPDVEQPDARVAFGGMGPVITAGAAATGLTPWAQSTYDKPLGTGRGVIAIERTKQIILLLVQEDHVGFLTTNGMTMAQIRDWLLGLGFDDAVFNDGSDSESLYADGTWLLEPGSVKDEVMDFAIGFVNKSQNKRARILAIDGTTSRDGKALVDGTSRPPITHYIPRNIATDLATEPALGSIASTFRDGVLQAWRATSASQADRIGGLFELGGSNGHWADLLYLSSHAWRHGELWYYANDNHAGPKLTIANPWSSGFRPVWRNSPQWLVLAGCAVLALRYTRGVKLDSIERGHLVDWHRDMHGSGAVPGLTPARATLFATYHPGWAWYERVFRVNAGIRGVLGYWYRSPSGGRDEEIVTAFTTRLKDGQPFLDAWEEANRGGWLDAEALWAAMVRDGCQGDTLATLEDPTPRRPSGDFLYFDRNQRGRPMAAAYSAANRRDEVATVGSVPLRHSSVYDALAIGELRGLDVAPTSTNLLIYSDGIGPSRP